MGGWSQGRAAAAAATQATTSAAATPAPAAAAAGSLAGWSGLTVRGIRFEGVAASRLRPLPGHLAQAEGAPLDPDEVKESLRQLFATGLYDTIEVEGVRQADGVELVFLGLRAALSGP